MSVQDGTAIAYPWFVAVYKSGRVERFQAQDAELAKNMADRLSGGEQVRSISLEKYHNHDAD